MNQITITHGLGTFASASTLVVVTVLSFALLAWLWRLARPYRIGVPIVLAVTMSSVVLVARIVLEGYLVNDEIVWHQLGANAATILAGDQTGSIEYVAGKEGYVWMLGTLYFVAGPTPLVPILVNIAAHGALAGVVALLTRELVDRSQWLSTQARAHAVRTAAFLVALAPSFFFWAPRNLREAVCQLLIAVALLGVIRFLRSRQPVELLLPLLALFLLWQLRAQVAAATATALAGAVILIWGIGGKYYALRVAVLLPLLVAGGAIAYSVAAAAFGLDVEQVSLRTRDLATAESGFPGASASGLSLLQILTISLPRVLAGPFLWEMTISPVMLLALVDGVLWIAVVLVALRSQPVRSMRKARATMDPRSNPGAAIFVLLVVAIALVAVLAFSITNYGILARMRAMPLVAVLPLAAVGWAMIRGSRRTARPKAPQSIPRPERRVVTT